MSNPETQRRCPTCDRSFAADTAAEFMPFCSERCKFADLHRWMTESIGIPSGSSEQEDDEEPAPESAPREWKFD